eukprot:gene41284-54706_t
MPLGTLDRTPPPFFKQGPSALSKLVVFSAVALFLMVADLRFRITVPIRTTMAAVLYPAQWLVLQPVQFASMAGGYFTSLHAAQQSEGEALKRLAVQAERNLQLEQISLENKRLRELLAMRERIGGLATGAQVLYDAADPYSRKIVIDRGQTHGIEAGSPVIDESGVLGQVTRVYPLVSEVTLLIDSDQAIPVLNTRTGVRSVAYGEPSTRGDGLELRYTLASADIAQGDLLSASKVSLNLGSLHLRHDAYADAARHYREAAVLFSRAGDREHSVMADIGLGDALAALGQMDEADRIYARARSRAGAHGLAVLEAVVDESQALLALARGGYGAALAGFERSRAGYERLAMPQHLAIAEKQLADAYLELRLLPEALALYQPALAQFDALDMPDDKAWTLTQAGRAHALLGQTQAAHTQFMAAA